MQTAQASHCTTSKQYNWPGPFKPFAHQRTTTQFIVDNKQGFVLDSMGLGKSASALWAIDQLMLRGEVGRVLVLAPLSTLRRVWLNESFKLLTHRNSVVLHGTADKRRMLYAQDNWDIGIINYEGINILQKQIAADKRLNMVVVDEASTYRNSQTQKYKQLRDILKRIPRVVLMTGTPCPEAPTDAFGLAKLINSPLAPRFFGAWRRQTMMQISQFKWVPRPDGFEQAYSILQPGIRHDKDDCLDLPPVMYEEWDVQLSAQQRFAYKHMLKKMTIEFAEQGDSLPAVNAADKINKLRQIACGVIKDTAKNEYIAIDHRPRADATLAAIEQASAKVIVVVPFKGIIYQLEKQLAKHYTIAVINGDVGIRKREEIIETFRSTPDPHVLLVHPKVMAHGLTLVEADVMVLYAPIYSNEESKQIVERINRPGQTRNMTIIRLGATALEWKIFGAVDRKAFGEDSLLGMYKTAIKEGI